jgi:galactokinase
VDARITGKNIMSFINQNLQQMVIAAFQQRFGGQPSHIARAPGRVNIIGEHTDYNDGFVLPAAIDKAIYIAGRRRNDDQINVISLDYDAAASFHLDNLHDQTLPKFTLYPRGVPFLMRKQGHPVGGMDLVLSGDVPRNAGFSSSAAVEVAMIEMMCTLFDAHMSQPEKALLGQQVEHQFIGVRSGIMDQMISAIGVEDHAVLIDCRSLEATPVPLPKDISIVVLDSGVKHDLVESEYNQRRQACEAASHMLGLKALRDATFDHVAVWLNSLPNVLRKRASHVIYENARAEATVRLLAAGDITTVGRLLCESHASLRDLYEVSVPKVDLLQELAMREADCYGARLMGGGFGGGVICLVDDSKAIGFAQRVMDTYNIATRAAATYYVAKAGPGSSCQAL